MAELDKKIQKSQTDLVQAVLEAQEKRNSERVDMLVTNAIKQLKMSRFKPDLTTCLSLIYLAKISPKVYHQSSAIKEVLKSLLRRDNGPANIKGKSDIVLPVLAANILLACCDSSEARSLILHKIEQWLGANTKASDMIQHLLATLCMKCQGDRQTIAFLVEIRQHWLQYLDENFEVYGRVPEDLCASVRKLLHIDAKCESLITYLKFLIKHDSNIDGLSAEVSRFIIERPISLENMLKEKENGLQLNKMILKIFIKLFNHLKSLSADQPKPSAASSDPKDVKMEVDDHEDKQTKTPIEQAAPVPVTKLGPLPGVIIKLEPKDQDLDEKPQTGDLINKTSCIKDETKPQTVPLQEPKKQTKNCPPDTPSSSTKEQSNPDSAQKLSDDENSPETQRLVRLLYVRLPCHNNVVALNQLIIEAVLNLLAIADEMSDNCREEFDELMNCWLSKGKIATIYEDHSQTNLYDLPDKLRQKLVQSSNDLLVELGLAGASVGQMIRLLQLFGSPLPTLNKILKRLETIKDIDSIRSEIKDYSYFCQFMDFYTQIGASSADGLLKRLEQTVI